MKFSDQIVDYAVKILSMFFLILLPIRPVMIAVGALIMGDFLTGIWASKKEGKPVTSTGFKKTVMKMLAYQVVIVFGFIIETYLMDNTVPIVKIIAGVIGLTEGKSFFENMHRITGIDFWAEALKRMQQATTNEHEEKKDK